MAAPVQTADGILGSGWEAPPSTPRTPISTNELDGFVEQNYALPTIRVGDEVNIIVTGKVNKADGDQMVLNQAWSTSTLTPRTKPTLPVDPGADYDPEGVYGNDTCSVNWGLDACDQVPVLIPATDTPLGALAGMVWVDTDRDGVRADTETQRVAEVPVSLYRGDTVVATTTTDENGRYLFENLVPGDDYSVLFGVRGLTDTENEGAAFGITTKTDGCVEGTSCADPVRAQTESVTVVANQTRDHVDAGLISTTTGATLDKTSEKGEPAYVEADTEVPVTAVYTNTGQDALVDIEWSDQTIEGPDVT